MPGRVHPSPWLDVFEIVISLYGFPQMSKGRLVVAPVIFELTVHHLLSNREDTASAVVENFALGRDAAHTFVKQLAFPFGSRKVPQCRVGDRLGIMLHCCRNRV